MLSRPPFPMYGLIVILAVFLSLVHNGVPWGGEARASLTASGGHFMSQGGPAAGEAAQTGTPPTAGLLESGNERDRASVRLYAGGSFRTDEFDWNIAGNMDGNSPNILSELTWEDLGVYELSMGFSSFIKKRVNFRGYMNYGRITSGKCQDSDYNSDDRRDEFSRSNNSADDGYTIDVSLGAGYMLPLFAETISIVPMIGLSYHRQHLTMSDGYQTIPPTGAFPGLDSSYEAQWRGPWVGLELQADIETGWQALPVLFPFVGFEFHWALYDAKADWNLREEFAHPLSFEHEAQGTGMRVMVGLGAALSERWALELGYTQQQWSAEDGTDRVFFSDGTYTETRLNAVNWNSRALGLFVRYQF